MFLNNEDPFSFGGEEYFPSKFIVPPNSMTLELIYSAIAESASDNRLVQGPSDCIEFLGRNPQELLICLIPVDESEKNVNLCIQLILIESICQEYGIPVLKVDKNQINQVLFNNMSITDSLFGKTLSQKASAFVAELDCCFIQSTEGNMGASERKLMNLLNSMLDEKTKLYPDFHK